MTILTRLAGILIVTFAVCGSTIAQSHRIHSHRHHGSPSSSDISGEAAIRDRLNASTIGLAGGLLEGAPIHFAPEIARVVNDGGALHLLPLLPPPPTHTPPYLLFPPRFYAPL